MVVDYEQYAQFLFRSRVIQFVLLHILLLAEVMSTAKSVSVIVSAGFLDPFLCGSVNQTDLSAVAILIA